MAGGDKQAGNGPDPDPGSGPAPGDGREPSPGADSSKERDPYFDNAKFLAVALVVVGHAWEPLRSAAIGGRALAAAQSFIYAFHLPVFIVMCGYFSRGFSRSRDRPRKLVARDRRPVRDLQCHLRRLHRTARGPSHDLGPARALLPDLVPAGGAGLAAVGAAVATAAFPGGGRAGRPRPALRRPRHAA